MKCITKMHDVAACVATMQLCTVWVGWEVENRHGSGRQKQQGPHFPLLSIYVDVSTSNFAMANLLRSGLTFQLLLSSPLSFLHVSPRT